MSNDYFNATGIPGQASFGSSAAIRALMSSVASGFDKLPILTGNALKLVRVNASATGLETLSSLDNAPIGQGGAAAGSFTTLSATATARLDAGAEFRSTTSVPLGGATGALMVGYLNGAVTSTTDAYVAYGGIAATALNPSGVGGSLILSARDAAGASLYLATRNAVRMILDDGGGFALNTPTTSGRNTLTIGALANASALLINSIATTGAAQPDLRMVRAGQYAALALEKSGIGAWYLSAGNSLANTFELSFNAFAPIFSVVPNAVGIGTASLSPAARLHVKFDQAAPTYVMVDNSGAVGASTQAGFAMAENGAITAFLRAYRDGSGTLELGNSANAPIIVTQSGAARMTVQAGGAIAIAGATGINGKTPVANVAAPAVATDLATVLTLANDMRTRLINFGLYT